MQAYQCINHSDTLMIIVSRLKLITARIEMYHLVFRLIVFRYFWVWLVNTNTRFNVRMPIAVTSSIQRVYLGWKWYSVNKQKFLGKSIFWTFCRYHVYFKEAEMNAVTTILHARSDFDGFVSNAIHQTSEWVNEWMNEGMKEWRNEWVWLWRNRWKKYVYYCSKLSQV